MPDESRLLNVAPPFEILSTPEEQYPRLAAALSSYWASAVQTIQRKRPPRWIVEGMIARGNVIVLAGAAKKAGKSWLSLHLARCVATGIPFLGRRTTQTRVVYANVEDGEGRIGYRMATLGFDENDDIPVNVVADRRGLLPLFEALPMLVNRLGVGLVIIDPLAKLERTHGIENENDSLQLDGLLDYYHTVAAGLDITFLFIHHFAKTTDRMRGSSAIEGGSDGWWNLMPGKSGHRYLTGTLRDGPDFELGVRYDFATPDRLILTPVDARLARPDSVTDTGSNSAGRRTRKPAPAPAQAPAPAPVEESQPEPEEGPEEAPESSTSDDAEKRRRRGMSDTEAYAEALAVLQARDGVPIRRTDLAGLIGGNKARALRVVDVLLTDKTAILTAEGIVIRTAGVNA